MNKFIERIDNFQLLTPTFGLIRSLLVLPTIILLIFNDTATLFSYTQYSLNCGNIFIPTAFCLIDNSDLKFEFIRFLMIIILFITLFGFFPRYTGILHWYICYSIQSSALTIDGGEQIATVLSFLLIPITLLDNRKNHFNYDKKNTSFIKKGVLYISYNLIKLQVCIIYLNAAIGRLGNIEWRDGTAIYYFLNDPFLGLSNEGQVILSPFLETNLLIIFTWSVTLIELFLAASIFANRNTKLVALGMGFLLHLGIIFTIGIWTFSLVMFSALLLYLAPIEYNLKNLRNISSIIFPKSIYK